jgi:hypothetical protein
VTSISYVPLVAGMDVELLTTADESATTALQLTGNNLNNLIAIDGQTGADNMRSNGDNNMYFVDNRIDQIIKLAAQGTADRVFTVASYTLRPGVDGSSAPARTTARGRSTSPATSLRSSSSATVG